MAGKKGTAVAKHPGGRPTDYRPEYCEQVQEFMRAGFSLTAFAGHVGVARSTINVWMGANPEFSEAVSRAKAARLLHWEEAAIRVAKDGGGGGTSTMIIFGLKNMAPEEYSDRQQLEHSGPNGGPIETKQTLDLSKLSEAELAAYRTIAAAAERDRAGD